MRRDRREHAVALHAVCVWSRHEGAESFGEFEAGQGGGGAKWSCDVCGAVAVRGLELTPPDVLVIEALEALVGDRGQVAAEPLEAATVAFTNRYVSVKVEPVGTRAKPQE